MRTIQSTKIDSRNNLKKLTVTLLVCEFRRSGGYGIIEQRVLTISSLGTGEIIRGELANVIRGSAAGVLPHDTHRTCGQVFGRLGTLI